MAIPMIFAGDDARWGHYAPDGAIADYPAVDVFGAPIGRGYGTVRRVNAALFVVIPPGKDSAELVVLPATAMTELPMDEPKRGRK